MIELKGVTKVYGNRVGIHNITLTVNRGEIVGLLGTNGAGKTTTMRIIAGYMPPTSGEVRVAGFDVLKEPREVKRRVGYLPEIPPVYPDMTVRTFLEFVAKMKSVPRARQRTVVSETIERVGLSEVADRLIGNLSRGYRQRVGIAQAILAEPDVLILDEPMTGLDPKQIVEIRQLIQNLARNRTVLFSSHILLEVTVLCDRVAIINRGRLVAQGTPAELSRLLRGRRRLHLEVDGVQDKVVAALKAVPGVAGVEVRGGRGSIHNYVVESGDEDVRRAVFRALAAIDAPLLRMEQEAVTLEKVFLELVARDSLSGVG